MATCGSHSQNVTVEGREGLVQQTKPVANYVAIDFGTTSSSLAYRNKDGKIENLDIDSSRTRVPTAMLMRKQDNGECKVESFGTVAQEAIHALPTEEYKNYHYFEFFKMNLHQKVRWRGEKGGGGRGRGGGGEYVVWSNRQNYIIASSCLAFSLVTPHRHRNRGEGERERETGGPWPPLFIEIAKKINHRIHVRKVYTTPLASICCEKLKLLQNASSPTVS